MKKLFISCLAALFLWSCSENKRITITETETTDASGHTTKETRIDTLAASPQKPKPAPGVSIRFSNVRTRIFSDPIRPDTFKLEMQGLDILKGKARFTITTAQGKRIHDEIISAPDLEASMVYEMKTPTATPAEREQYIKNRFNTFFAEAQFTKPAIAPHDLYDPAYGNEKAWNALKADTSAVSFNYLLGKENGKRIAWSALQKKVMTVGFFGG